MDEPFDLTAIRLKFPTIAFIHINDVYHIESNVDGERLLPRIATVVRRLKEWLGPDCVFLCLPGDFLAPSCLSKESKGAHMIDVLNAMGADFVSLGNHEFEDIFSPDDVYD